MRRKKKSKRGIIDENIPTVSESEAKRQVIYGGIGFTVSCFLVILFRPGTDHLMEMIILIGIVASSTFGGMKLASWVESKQYNLKG
jgi:Na+/H+ antiporter NhaA